jgi:hypothetical protein
MQEPTSNVQNGLLSCTLDKTVRSLFFSLVDYRNSLFTSNDPEKIIEFYDGFENRDQLIQWMKERPKGVSYIHEVEGDKDIIVVIPTADFNGEYARECRENIFKGLHIVFVESGIGNFYFNYAHNCNVGIKKAMEYNPKWVVVSNDDMYKIDDVSKLVKELGKVNEKLIDVVFTHESIYHSIPAGFGKQRFTRYPLRMLLMHKVKILDRILLIFKQIKIERKLGCNYFVYPVRGHTKYIFKPGFTFVSFTDFGIFSSEFLKQKHGNLFDETFVNAQEDHDIMIEFFIKTGRFTFIDFQIGDYIGSSLTVGISREFRELAGIAYLNFKWQETIEGLLSGK